MAGKAKNILPYNVQAIAKAASIDGKQTEYQVEGVPGLALIVQPTGHASWWYRYTTTDRGKRNYRKIKIGTRVGTTSADAREAAISYQRRVEAGEDPVATSEQRDKAVTLFELLDRFISEAELATSTRNNYRNYVSYYIPTEVGEKPAFEITQDDVIDICKAMEAQGHFRQSERTKGMLGGCYRFAIHNGIVKASPVVGIGSRIPERLRKARRTRSPSAEELATIWNGMADKSKVAVSDQVQAILKLAILLGQRRTEICGMRQEELRDLDGESPVWVIPGDETVRGKLVRGRTKNGQTQTVYLPAQAVMIIKEELGKSDQEYVFPARTSVLKIDGKGEPRTPHINGEAVTKAMRNIRLAFGIEGLTPHDFRRGIANWLKDAGYSSDVRELVLNHKDDSVNAQHYANSAKMAEQCRRAWKEYAEYVTMVVGGEDADRNVVPIQRAS